MINGNSKPPTLIIITTEILINILMDIWDITIRLPFPVYHTPVNYHSVCLGFN